jgi:glutamate N-acetyltransferase / amino-acid N-acetyltransferase
VSVTAAAGFVAAGVHAGIRRAEPDLAVVRSMQPAVGAAMFTRNRVLAAPLVVSRAHLAEAEPQAVVVNSGVANAATGVRGELDAIATAAEAGRLLDLDAEEVLVLSTGVIGALLPLEKVTAGLAQAVPALSARGGPDAARAIMTTDTRPKEHAATASLGGGREARVGGMAKGAGMIHPQMATMLAFLTTDAAVDPILLGDLLREAVDRSFNQVTVDGDTSTNDAVIVLANGAAGGEPIATDTDVAAFAAALDEVCRELAIAIATDGEGAEHLIEVHVSGARDDVGARAVARTVAGSALVKTAVHGADPNWGRIAAAAGRSGVELDVDRLRVCIGDVAVYEGGPRDFDEAAAKAELRAPVVKLTLDLGAGPGHGIAWGCDLTAEYVAINSEYTT